MSTATQPFPIWTPNPDSMSMKSNHEFKSFPSTTPLTLPNTAKPTTIQFTTKPKEEVMHEINLNDNVTVHNQPIKKNKLFTSKLSVGLVVFSFITSILALAGFMFVSVMTSWGQHYFWGSVALGIPLALLFGVLTPMNTFACTMAVPSYKPTWIGILSFVAYVCFFFAAVVWVISLIMNASFGQIPVILTGLFGFTSNLAICLELLFIVSPSRSPFVKNDANIENATANPTATEMREMTTPLPVYNPSPIFISSK